MVHPVQEHGNDDGCRGADGGVEHRFRRLSSHVRGTQRDRSSDMFAETTLSITSPHPAKLTNRAQEQHNGEVQASNADSIKR